MVAKSTTAGTPVKSWSSTRAGMKAISFCATPGVHEARDLMSSAMDEAAVFKAEKIFEQNAQRERKRGELGDSLFFEMFEAVNFEGLCADVEGVARFEGVASGDGHSGGPFVSSHVYDN